MLAWVLWDAENRCLVAARDRIGQHPLLFLTRGSLLAVAERAAALFELLGASPSPDSKQLVAYLHGLPPTHGTTCLQNVASVGAGELAVFHAGTIERRTYWQPEATLADAGEAPQPADAILATLRQSVADGVPPGFALTLSGGVDSASVAVVLAERNSQIGRAPPRALTGISPSLPEADETAAAGATAERLGLQHTLVPADDLVPLSDPRWVSGELESPSRLAYPELWRAMCVAAKDLGVPGLATGMGGDVLFGYGGAGLYTYPDLLLKGRWVALARQLSAHRRVSSAPFQRILDRDLIRPLLRELLPSWRRSKRALPWLRREQRPTLSALRDESKRSLGRWTARGHHLRLLSHSLTPELLVEMAWTAAGAGIEVRHPLLDPRLVELSAGLPSEAIFSAGTYKVALREAMRDRLPQWVLGRREKFYPSALLHRGLSRAEPTIRELLTDMRAAALGLVDESRLSEAYESYRADGRDTRFWSALALELWLRRHFD